MVSDPVVIGALPQIRMVRGPYSASYAAMRVEYAPSVLSTYGSLGSGTSKQFAPVRRASHWAVVRAPIAGPQVVLSGSPPGPELKGAGVPSDWVLACEYEVKKS